MRAHKICCTWKSVLHDVPIPSENQNENLCQLVSCCYYGNSQTNQARVNNILHHKLCSRDVWFWAVRLQTAGEQWTLALGLKISTPQMKSIMPLRCDGVYVLARILSPEIITSHGKCNWHLQTQENPSPDKCYTKACLKRGHTEKWMRNARN